MEITKVKQIQAHTDEVYDAKYSPNGQWLATASFDKTVAVWDTQASTSSYAQHINRLGSVSALSRLRIKHYQLLGIQKVTNYLLVAWISPTFGTSLQALSMA